MFPLGMCICDNTPEVICKLMEEEEEMRASMIMFRECHVILEQFFFTFALVIFDSCYIAYRTKVKNTIKN